MQKLFKLMKFRNSCRAFNDEFVLKDCAEDSIIIERKSGTNQAVLEANLKTKAMEISYTDEKGD